MKNYLLLVVLLPTILFSQESFKKTYLIKDSSPVTAKKINSNDTIYLQKTVTCKYKDLPQKEKDSVDKKFKSRIGEVIKYISKETINGVEVEAFKTVTVSEEYYKDKKYSYVENVKPLPSNKKRKGYVLFEKNKVYVNQFLKGEGRTQHQKTTKDNSKIEGREDIYFYKLKNRQTLKLNFWEGTVTALVIPIKYRFEDKENEIKEDFSTSFNVNMFVGISKGSTSFFHRKKVGNKSNTSKHSLGLILGTSTVTLDKSNTSIDPLGDDDSFTKGLASIGVGYTYSFNKINFGVFYGWDYAIGEYASRWDYNKKPWLGFGLGYSLFAL